MNHGLFLTIGYIVFVIYTCGIMYLGTVVEKKTNMDKEICRKLTHVVSAFVWVIMQTFFGCTIHWVILNGVGTIALGFVTFGNFLDTYSRDDADKSYGLFYFGLSTFIVALITFLLGEEYYLYAGIAYFCLALGDGLAPIVVKLCHPFRGTIMPGRSLVGSLTVFVVSALTVTAFSALFHMELKPLFILSVASLTCITEFYGLKGCDNLLIEFSVYGYLLLYAFGLVTPLLQIVILVTPLIALPAIRWKALSVSGGIAALIFIFALAFLARRSLDVIYTAVIFIAVSISSKLSKKLGNKKETQKKSGRNGYQITGVGLWALVAVTLNYIFGAKMLYLLFFLALAEQFSDSMASDIGSITKKKNIDIITLKPVEKGLSGGVSLLGTLCACIGAFGILLIPYAFSMLRTGEYVTLALLAFAGAMIDSVLGSLLQALYLCPECGEKTELPEHCNRKTTHIKGLRIIDNVSVNLISGLITCIIGGFILLI